MKKPEEQTWNERCDRAIIELLGPCDPKYAKMTVEAIHKALKKANRLKKKGVKTI